MWLVSCAEPLRQHDCNYFRRKAPEVLEDEECTAQLEECDDFVRAELVRDFVKFNYPLWNTMIDRLSPESDDGEEEEESNVSKGKGQAAGSSKVGPPAALTQTLSKAKPLAQTAGKVMVKPVPKARITQSKSMTDMHAGEKPAPVSKAVVRLLVLIVGIVC